MPVGGNYIDRIGTGQSRHVQVRQLAHQLLIAAAAVESKRKSAGNHQRHCDGQNGDPEPVPTGRPACRNALLNAGPKGGVRRKPLAGSLYRTLLLNPAQALRGTSGAASQMLAQCPRLAGWKLTVKVRIEFFRPSFADHD